MREGVHAARAVSISLEALTTVLMMKTMAAEFEAAQQAARKRRSLVSIPVKPNSSHSSAMRRHAARASCNRPIML